MNNTINYIKMINHHPIKLLSCLILIQGLIQDIILNYSLVLKTLIVIFNILSFSLYSELYYYHRLLVIYQLH